MAALSEPVAVELTPGQRLRQAREAKDWSLAEVATHLHLSSRVVDDIERDVLSNGVELPFVRGYLKNYAKLLGLVPDELARAFDVLHRGKPVEPPIKPIVSSRHEPLESSSSWGLLVGAGLLLLVGGAYLWWQSQQAAAPVPALASPEASPAASVAAEPAADTAAQPGTDAAGAATATGPEPVTAINLDTTAPDNKVPASASTSPALPATQPGSAPTDPVPATARADVAAAGAAPVTNATEAVGTSTAQLAMNFNGDCWVKIEDASGTVLSRGLKRAGNAVTLAGAPPFKLILGNPGVVSITFKGEAVDLSGYPANQVAKLQLGASG